MSSKAISAETKAQMFWGIYESAEARFICKYLPGNSDVVELGSSLGFSTLSHIKHQTPVW